MTRLSEGDDLRREPLDVRKAPLRSLLVKTGPGLRWNEHIEGDGNYLSPYLQGAITDYLHDLDQIPFWGREAEEDMGRNRWRTR